MQFRQRFPPIPFKSEIQSPKETTNPTKDTNPEEQNSIVLIRVIRVIRGYSLAFVMLALAPIWADEPTREQQTNEIQKQIQQLNKKLEDLKQAKANAPAAPPGAI